MARRSPFRWRLFVDWRVQGALVGRAILYWFACLATIVLMLVCRQVIIGPAQPLVEHFRLVLEQLRPAMVASLVLLPLVLVDIVRMSNRFAGPLVRLRRSMQELAEGQPVEPLQFRRDDFWREVAEQFNALLARVQKR